MKTSIVMLAGLLLCSCATQPAEEYTYRYNTATGSIDTVKPISPILYAIGGLAAGAGSMGAGSMNFSPGSINVSPGSFSGLGHCSAGAK